MALDVFKSRVPARSRTRHARHPLLPPTSLWLPAPLLSIPRLFTTPPAFGCQSLLAVSSTHSQAALCPTTAPRQHAPPPANSYLRLSPTSFSFYELTHFPSAIMDRPSNMPRRAWQRRNLRRNRAADSNSSTEQSAQLAGMTPAQNRQLRSGQESGYETDSSVVSTSDSESAEEHGQSARRAAALRTTLAARPRRHSDLD